MIAEFVDGFVSAVIGYVVGILVPAFLTVYAALNTPWYFTLLLLELIAIFFMSNDNLPTLCR